MNTLVPFILVVVVTLFTVGCGDKSPTGPTVVPVPQALPPVSDVAKAMILENNVTFAPGGGNGRTVRWGTLPVKVWADENFPAASVQKAVDFWNSEFPGFVVLVATEREANFSLSSVWPPPYEVLRPELLDVSCGVAGPRDFRGNTVTSALGSFAFLTKPQCTLGDNLAGTIAHEMGHALILYMGHTNEPGVIGKPFKWSIPPALKEVITWLYAVPPNTKLE